MDVLKRIEEIQKELTEALGECKDAFEAEDLRIKYLGRKGKLTEILRSLSELPEGERKEAGKRANIVKNECSAKIDETKKGLETLKTKEKASGLDVTLPGAQIKLGTAHPVTRTMSRINEIFVSLGFGVEDGPEIETEFYNFEALNIPLDHPSRDAFDTFYIESGTLLRSHTSNVQIHLMQKQSPPIQAIMPGRVYRPDSVDASHSFMFHQVEGLMVDKDIKFSDLKGVLTLFCKSMFGEDIKMRFRPHFFPFTEPSAEVDISCIICKGEGCRVCKGNGWLEILGAGMVDPKVFKAVDYAPGEYTGYAFGMGVERIAMLLHGVEDIRLFFENDIRFLKQFR